MKQGTRYTPFLIAVFSLLLFIPFLGSTPLFDWDEINFAECAREMLVSHNYSTVQVGFLPFWEKPPLFIWMQAISMKLFGINEFAARFPDAICGVVTLLVIYKLGKKISDERFGRLWTLAYAGSVLPAFYFHSGIIDPWFNLFIFLSIYNFTLYLNDHSAGVPDHRFNRNILLSAVFIALAVLTKGPVAWLIFGLCFIVLRVLKRQPLMSWTHFFHFAALTSGVAGLWFLFLALSGNGHLIIEFILYQVRLFSTEDAGHGGSFFYHWIVLLAGCFPASVFAVRSLLRGGNDTPFEKIMLRSMRVLFWVVLILFSIVKTKIIHYSSLCYFPLTYLAASAWYRLSAGTMPWKKWMTTLLGFIFFFYISAFLSLPFIDHFKSDILSAGMSDKFAAGNLQAQAHWNGFEWIAGIVLLAGVITGFYFLSKRSINRAITAFFISTLVSAELAVTLLAPRVEEFSQDAAVSFWKEHAHQDVYLGTLGYKSYAQYFYGNLQPGIEKDTAFLSWKATNSKRLYNPTFSVSENELRLRSEWTLTGNIDKPALFVSKNTFEKDVRHYYPELTKTGEKNGFVFWKRLPGH